MSNFDKEAKEPINKQGKKKLNLDDSDDDDKSDGGYNNRNNDSGYDDNMSNLAADLRSARNKKIIFYSIGTVVAGLIVLLIVLMFKGGD
jgi:t-SNARE complex subunit (syntaxin)